MKPIKTAYFALLTLLAMLWFLADDTLWTANGFFPLRNGMVQLTGVIGMGVMSVAMMLAIRPGRIEPWLGGLDKSYRLHKWLGITALVVSITHWLWAKGPKWAVGLGWLEKPRRGAGPPLGDIEQWFRAQRHLAEGVGEWAFYGAVVLMLLALVKWFPYRHFFKTHRLLAIAYLVLVFHGVILLDMNYWAQPVGLLVAALMLGGTFAAFTSLFRRIGAGRRALGEVAEVVHREIPHVLSVAVQLHDRWPGHVPGQFAFLTFDKAEGPHPFTISSAWRGDGRLQFHIKELGDYTKRLPTLLRRGNLVTVEGPYGCFDFNGRKPGQIWVAGGIGLTPFIARLQALEGRTDDRSIDLFYSTNVPDDDVLTRLRSLAERARVRLHVWVTQRDGFLTGARLRAAVPHWQGADVWFCGPAGFADSLRCDLVAAGMAQDDFHQELFAMR